MKIFLCGDVMTGRGIDQILHHPARPRIFESYVKDARDYVKLAENENGIIPRDVSDSYIWGDALSIWHAESPDLSIMNLETAITSCETPLMGKGINYRMHPDNVSVLKAIGVEVCTLANNHVLDWGKEGFKETIESLDHAGIMHAGAGMTIEEAMRPAVFNHHEGRVLVFSLCLETSGVPWDWEASERGPGVWLLYDLKRERSLEVKSVIDRHCKAGDLIVVSVHWGSNWGHSISEGQKQFARDLMDEAGVHIVHGHSSHHPRAIEIYKGHPILYGCGDFINDYEGISGHESFRGDLSLMYFIDCDTRPFKLRSLHMNCMQISRMSLHDAKASDAQWMKEMLTEVSLPFATSFEMAGKNIINVRV